MSTKTSKKESTVVSGCAVVRSKPSSGPIPVKWNVPVPSRVILLTVRRAALALVKVQVSTSPGSSVTVQEESPTACHPSVDCSVTVTSLELSISTKMSKNVSAWFSSVSRENSSSSSSQSPSSPSQPPSPSSQSPSSPSQSSSLRENPSVSNQKVPSPPMVSFSIIRRAFLMLPSEQIAVSPGSTVTSQESGLPTHPSGRSVSSKENVVSSPMRTLKERSALPSTVVRSKDPISSLLLEMVKVPSPPVVSFMTMIVAFFRSL